MLAMVAPHHTGLSDGFAILSESPARRTATLKAALCVSVRLATPDRIIEDETPN